MSIFRQFLPVCTVALYMPPVDTNLDSPSFQNRDQLKQGTYLQRQSSRSIRKWRKELKKSNKAAVMDNEPYPWMRPFDHVQFILLNMACLETARPELVSNSYFPTRHCDVTKICKYRVMVVCVCVEREFSKRLDTLASNKYICIYVCVYIYI